MQRELGTINMVDQFAKYAKLERKINRLKEELSKISKCTPYEKHLQKKTILCNAVGHYAPHNLSCYVYHAIFHEIVAKINKQIKQCSEILHMYILFSASDKSKSDVFLKIKLGTNVFFHIAQV